MDANESNESLCYEFLPIYAQVMELTKEQILELGNPEAKDSEDTRDEIIYKGVLEFSRSHKLSFYSCAVFAQRLYTRQKVTKKDVEKHLLEKLQGNLGCSISSSKPHKKYKTIMVVGRSGEGKSTTVNYIASKEIAPIGHKAKSETSGIRLYVIDELKLNIIDTEGLDGTHTDILNEELINRIRQKILYYLELDASIDAILVMWCPLKNGRSGLVKTIKSLQEAFGDDIVKSCIAVIQGNWEPLAEILSLTKAVPREVQAVREQFPEMPIMHFDAMSPDVKITSTGYLDESVHQVKPYLAELFEENQMTLFYQMARAFKLKLKELEGRQSEEVEIFCNRFEENFINLLCNREKIAQKKDKAVEKIIACLKLGTKVAGSGLLVGLTGTAVGSTTVLCLGVGGALGGVVVFSAATAVGTLYGFGKVSAWVYNKVLEPKDKV